MSAIRNVKLPPFKDDKIFEEFCVELWKRILRDPNTQFNGRSGQCQHGVDLFGRRYGSNDWVGIQCKVRTSETLNRVEIINGNDEAKHFNPKLKELHFATTARRDQSLQELTRSLTLKNENEDLFSVQLYSWDDIELELSKEENLDLCQKYYRDFFIDYEKLGIAISKIIAISVGTHKFVDTRYELIFGKTASPSEHVNSYGLNYWKGNYFIVNLSSGRFTLIPPKVYPSDLELLFCRRDSFIIAKWLNGIGALDELIYGELDEYSATISADDYRSFVESMKHE